MASKFGGVPVEDKQPGGSKFGGVPVVDTGSSPSATPKPSATDPMREDIGTRVIRGVLGPLTGSMTTLGRGLHGIAHPSAQPLSDTAADVIEGGAGVALPFAVPGMLAHPGIAAAAGVAGLGGRAVGERAASELGASPGVSRLVGDAAGAVAGGGAGFGASRLNPAGVRGALGGAYEASKQIPLVGKIIRIPEAMVNGYQEAVKPPPLPEVPAPQAPEPFRIKPNISKQLGVRGVASPFDPTAGLQVGKLIPRRGFTPPEPEAAPAAPAPQAPEPFRIKPNISKQLGRRGVASPYDPTADLQSSPKPTLGGRKGPGALPSGSREVVIQHKGDPRLPGRAPEDPKMFDSFGRPLARPNRWSR